jgi:hypothetical protein
LTNLYHNMMQKHVVPILLSGIKVGERRSNSNYWENYVNTNVAIIKKCVILNSYIQKRFIINVTVQSFNVTIKVCMQVVINIIPLLMLCSFNL